MNNSFLHKLAHNVASARRKDRPPSKPLQTRLGNEAPTVDRGEGDVDSSSHAAESVDGSEVTTGSSQQLIPANVNSG